MFADHKGERLIPSEMLSVTRVATILDRSPDWVRRVANDSLKPLRERRYPPHVHATFPPLKKNGRTWEIWGPRLHRHLESLARRR